ncbi:ankyrin repeat domain-containing protein [Candidatus Acetothermia bacterium]|nr:ankyrin repeat domain-containing protein [Candidatus Acetothermia bacterium]
MTQAPTREEVEQFIIAAHGNFPKMKELLDANPALLHTRWDKTNEMAIEAAAHVGNKQAAEYLLSKGASLDICTAAMLGMNDKVASFLKENSKLANAKGAHGIPVLFFAALSGDTKIAELLVSHGSREGVDSALQGAVRLGRTAMVKWLLDRGANVNTKDFEGKTPLQVATERNYTEIIALLQPHANK